MRGRLRLGAVGIDELLGTGIDVNSEFTTLTERNGGTAVHCAAREGKTSGVGHLLSRGADPDMRINSLTALEWCRRRCAEIGPGWGHAEVEEFLTEASRRS